MLPLTNGWTNSGGAFAAAAWRRIPGRRIELRGLLSTGNAAGITPAGAIPANARPPGSLMFPAATWSVDHHGRVIVASNGSVSLNVAADVARVGSWVSLSGIVWSTI